MTLSFFYLFPVCIILTLIFIFFSNQIWVLTKRKQKHTSLRAITESYWLICRKILKKETIYDWVKFSKSEKFWLKDNKNFYTKFFQLGTYQLQKKEYIESLYLLIKSIEIWDEDDQIGLASAYNALGLTCYNMKKFEEAINYFILSTRANNLLNTQLNLAMAYEQNNEKLIARDLFKRISLVDNEQQFARMRYKNLCDEL